MSKKATLLWVDLEMTGLDPQKDVILEVAAIATDWQLNELAVYEGVIKQPIDLINERMAVSQDFWDKFPDTRQALVDQNKHGKVSELIEDSLLKFIDDNFKSRRKVILAGNSIHQDRLFINNGWPRLAERLHYRMLDVSAWKVVFEGMKAVRFTKPEAHRALSDIRGSIDELKFYTSKIES